MRKSTGPSWKLIEGESEAIETVRQVYNDLLEQKVKLLQESGDVGKMVLFIDQLPALFSTYQQSAQSQSVENLMVLNDDEGFNSAVNRGPAALADFLNQLEASFGINIKKMMTV